MARTRNPRADEPGGGETADEDRALLRQMARIVEQMNSEVAVVREEQQAVLQRLVQLEQSARQRDEQVLGLLQRLEALPTDANAPLSQGAVATLGRRLGDIDGRVGALGGHLEALEEASRRNDAAGAGRAEWMATALQELDVRLSAVVGHLTEDVAAARQSLDRLSGDVPQELRAGFDQVVAKAEALFADVLHAFGHELDELADVARTDRDRREQALVALETRVEAHLAERSNEDRDLATRLDALAGAVAAVGDRTAATVDGAERLRQAVVANFDRLRKAMVGSIDQLGATGRQVVEAGEARTVAMAERIEATVEAAGSQWSAPVVDELAGQLGAVAAFVNERMDRLAGDVWAAAPALNPVPSVPVLPAEVPAGRRRRRGRAEVPAAAPLDQLAEGVAVEPSARWDAPWQRLADQCAGLEAEQRAVAATLATAIDQLSALAAAVERLSARATEASPRAASRRPGSAPVAPSPPVSPKTTKRARKPVAAAARVTRTVKRGGEGAGA